MLKIKIGNTTFEYLEALETEEFFNGSSRRTITVTCNPNVISIDELNALLVEENLSNIVMENEESNIVNYYDGYVLKLLCGIQNKLIQAESLEAPAVYEDRLVFKIGKRTYIEQKLHELGI